MPSVKPRQYHYFIALTADFIGRIPAIGRVVPAGRSQVKAACLPVSVAPIQRRGHITAPKGSHQYFWRLGGYEAGGWEKKRKPTKMPMCSSPNRTRRKGEREKVRMSLTLLNM